MSVLLDTGSTNNFIQTRVAKHLGLIISPAGSFQVMIGDGQKLPCSSLCKDVTVDIQGFSFTTSFYVLPIQGVELVLGVQWLQELGPITIDYSELTMKFSHMGNAICLHGDQSPTSSQISHHQLKRLLEVDAVATCFQLLAQKDTSPTNFTNNSLIDSVLGKFSQIFEPPSSLPPFREIQHRIHLVNGTSAINVKPYRYPHFQKAEIEKQVKEMLAQGLIQNSISSYSSPVLLVKKKDGS